MENRFHRNIQIPVEFKQFKVKTENDIIGEKNFEKPIDLLELDKANPEFVAWLASLNLKVAKARYIESRPDVRYELHVDDYRPAIRNIIKLNFIFSSFGSEMIWYDLLPGFSSLPQLNGIGEYMPIYPDHHVIEIYRHPANSHCLIDGRHIHTLQNSSNQGVNRICYSLFMSYNNTTDKKLDWDSAIEILSPYIRN